MKTVMELLNVGDKKKPRYPKIVDPDQKIEFYSFGSLILDMGFYGLPRGRAVELYGNPGTGKTLTAMIAARTALEAELTVLWIDQEQVFDPQWAMRVGLDINKRDAKGEKLFILVQPDNAEDALIIFRNFCEEPAADLLVLDSVAALNPTAEKAVDIDKNTQMGLIARMLSREMRILAPLLRANPRQPAVIMINQVRDKMDMYDKATHTPGGKAVKFIASMRIELITPEDIPSKDGMDIMQLNIRCKCRKSKIGTPRKATFTMTLDLGPDRVYYVNQPMEAFAIAKRYGVFSNRAGGVWSKGVAIFEGTEIGKSEKEIVFKLSTDYDLFQAVYAKCIEVIKSGAPKISSEEGDDADDGGESEDIVDELPDGGDN